MKISIVGGSGMIGQRLASSLISGGHAVTVLSRRSESRREGPAGEGPRRVGWSVDATDALAMTFGGHDAVVNLTGAKVGPRRWTAARKRELRSSRVATTHAIVTAIGLIAPERRPRVLVSMSGTDGYTRADDEFLTEADADAGAPGFLAEVSRDWEAEAERAGSLGVRVVIIRAGPIISREATVLKLLALPVRLGVGGRLGSGQQWISWIHMTDLIGVIERAISDDAMSGAINAVTPNPVRQIELTRAIGRRIRRPVWTWVPAVVLRIVIGEGASVVLGSRRVRPARLEEAGFDFRYPTIESALEEALT